METGRRAEVIQIIADMLGVDAGRITDDTAIGDLPEWDSLHHIRIISAIEKKYGFHFTPDVIMELEDVSDMVAAAEAGVRK